jgi:4-aminobutyrate aminotransferase-like enzyme
MRDADGRVLLDLGSQTSNLAIGQSHPAVADAASRQVQRLLYASSSFSSEPFLELSKRLVALAPTGLTAANLMMCNGSDAVETACKLARVYKGSPTMLAIRGAWHGESIATLAFSPSYKDSLLITDQNVVLSAEPTLDSLIELIASRPDAAGVVLDPIGVSNGLFTRAEIDASLPRIRQLCTEHDIVLIFDEVQSFGGFLGGSLFAAEAFGVSPDILCVAKAIGGGLPLAGLLCRGDLTELLSHNEAEYTNGANPVSCAAALAFLDVYASEREQFEHNVQAFQEAVADLAAECGYLEFRSHGLVVTCRMAEDRFRERWAARASKLALEAGIILRVTNFGQNILLKPSLLIEPEVSAQMAKRLAEVFHSAADHVARCGVSMVRLRSGLETPEPDSAPPPPASTADYFRDMLAAIDPTFKVRSRNNDEIEDLTRRLPRIGVRVSRAFASGSAGLEYEPMSGWALDGYLLGHGALPDSAINGLLVQHMRALESAHANGVIIGGRATHNAVVDSSIFLQLTDFETAYTGTFDTLAAFEDLYGLFDFGAHLVDPASRSKVLRRMAPVVFRRWRQHAIRSWTGIRHIHLMPSAPAGGPRISSEVHRHAVDVIDRVASDLEPSFEAVAFLA